MTDIGMQLIANASAAIGARLGTSRDLRGDLVPVDSKTLFCAQHLLGTHKGLRRNWHQQTQYHLAHRSERLVAVGFRRTRRNLPYPTAAPALIGCEGARHVRNVT